jgi:RHS repeat-associated protein
LVLTYLRICFAGFDWDATNQQFNWVITDYHDSEQWWVYGDDSMDATQWIDFDVEVADREVEIKEGGATKISKSFSEAIPQGAVGLATFNRDALFDDFSIDEAQYEVSRVFTNSPEAVGGIIIAREYTTPETYTDTWFHYDALGSVMNYSNASGIATATYHQDAYGNVIDASTGAWLNESSQAGFHLTTKEYDADVGLYFFWARWYEAKAAKYLGRSPFRADEEHPYSFASNNPLTFSDAKGLWPTVIGGTYEDRKIIAKAVVAFCKNLHNPTIDWYIGGKYSSRGWKEKILSLRCCARDCCQNYGHKFFIIIGGLWCKIRPGPAGYTEKPPLRHRCHFHVCPGILEKENGKYVWTKLILNTVAHETMHSCGILGEKYPTDIGDEFEKLPFP